MSREILGKICLFKPLLTRLRDYAEFFIKLLLVNIFIHTGDSPKVVAEYKGKIEDSNEGLIIYKLALFKSFLLGYSVRRSSNYCHNYPRFVNQCMFSAFL